MVHVGVFGHHVGFQVALLSGFVLAMEAYVFGFHAAFVSLMLQHV